MGPTHGRHDRVGRGATKHDHRLYEDAPRRFQILAVPVTFSPPSAGSLHTGCDYTETNADNHLKVSGFLIKVIKRWKGPIGAAAIDRLIHPRGVHLPNHVPSQIRKASFHEIRMA
ncbi:uncharacterized protein LOC118511550 [Anopheles stephensi]|uniref:uncharacterized protein LOC118511550 n=1 Tax=Anopheles stephensi TaxID=30069 RepID=UPI001658C1D7|nr:uncharacterized protein LOC118511550 [Anopheles stephensi]